MKAVRQCDFPNCYASSEQRNKFEKSWKIKKMKIGKKCSCILLKTNITNGYITIYKNQLDLFVFSYFYN